jgi:hypothetical protein
LLTPSSSKSLSEIVSGLSSLIEEYTSFLQVKQEEIEQK